MDIACRECGVSFVFSDNQVTYYKTVGLHTPSRCPDCRRLSKLFPYENLDISINSSPIEVVCPVCGTIHSRAVELAYRFTKTAWKAGGYLVRACYSCMEKRESVVIPSTNKGAGVR